MNKNCFYLIMCLLILGCKKKGTNSVKFPGGIASVSIKNKITKINHKPIEITIDLDKTIEGDFDDYFELKKIIYLSNESPIGDISVTRQYNDNLFILDRNNTQELFCFNLKGELIWKFNSKGGGPLEYGKISDFIINVENNAIDVLDSKRYKIISLDANTGTAKTEFKLGCYASEMILYDDKEYLLHTNNKTITNDLDYKLLLLNTEKEITSRNLPLLERERKKRWKGFRSIERYRETVFFTEKFNDTIYTIKNDTLRTAYYIDYLDKKYPNKLLLNFSVDKAKKLNKTKPFISSIDMVREKNGILNFTFAYNKEFYTVFYDIKNESTFIFNKLRNGYRISDFSHIFPRGYIDDGFIDIINPYFLSNSKKSIKSSKDFEDYLKNNKSEMYNIILNTDEYSNPILFVYEFKKNS